MTEMTAITIWGRRNSFNVQKVMWLVGELGLAHEHIDAGGSFGGLDDAAFRAMNPHGRVPVLRDGETIVWESHAILRYLAAQHGGERFWPGDAARRADADQWMDWSQTALQPAFLTGIFWGYYSTPAAERDWAAIRASLERCSGYFRLLDRILAERRFLAGDDFGLADIPAGTTLYRYFELDIARPAVPHVEAWYARLKARPAYRRHVMIPFGDLYGRLDY